MHPDPTTIRLIHRHMIQEELARHRRPDRDGPGDLDQPQGITMATRRITAGALRAIARWIEPRPCVDQSLTPTKPAT